MTKILSILKKYWVWILIGILIIPIIIKAYKGRKTSTKDKENTSDSVLNEIGVSMGQRGAIKKLTIEVAHHLGTSYGFLDPRRWTENDKEVFELLKDITQKEYDIIKVLYFKVYAKGRTLTEDLAKFLDDKYYRQLNLV